MAFSATNNLWQHVLSHLPEDEEVSNSKLLDRFFVADSGLFSSQHFAGVVNPAL